VFETYQWTQSNNRARREREKLEQSMLDATAHRSLTTTSQKPPANGRGGDISPPPPPSTFNETMRALEERGQKIQEVSEKSEALREVRNYLISFFFIASILLTLSSRTLLNFITSQGNFGYRHSKICSRHSRLVHPRNQ
jgi:hypothetical protein